MKQTNKCINHMETTTKTKNDDTLYKQYHGRFRKYRGQSVVQVLNQEKDVFDCMTVSSSVIQMEGLICIPNCLSPTIQNYFNYKCVSQYTQHPPYMTNLSTNTTTTTTTTTTIQKSNSPLKKKAKVSMDDLWEEYKDFNATTMTKKRNKRTDPAARLYKKLTWSTVGYVYNWTQRCYQESYQAPMPTIFQTLAQSICRDFYNSSQQPNLNFVAQAGIINYYHLNSNGMGGHKDDAELTYEYPVISVSLGLCPGIFLLQTSSTKVLPLLLRPGDVILFHGPLRLALHGMPCVLQPEQQLSKDETSYQYNTIRDIGIKDNEKDVIIPEEDVIHLRSYMNTHRININLRQVLPDKMTSIPSSPPPPPS